MPYSRGIYQPAAKLNLKPFLVDVEMTKFLILFFAFAAGLEAVTIPAAAALKFNFTGYTNVATLMVTNCTTDVHSQVNAILGGSKTIDVIEIPTTNPTRPHVTCASDSLMGKAINFTLYTTDNDPVTGYTDRQRLEMKVFEKSPKILQATNNSHYIYSWWFHLDPLLQAGGKLFLNSISNLKTKFSN